MRREAQRPRAAPFVTTSPLPLVPPLAPGLSSAATMSLNFFSTVFRSALRICHMGCQPVGRQLRQCGAALLLSGTAPSCLCAGAHHTAPHAGRVECGGDALQWRLGGVWGGPRQAYMLYCRFLSPSAQCWHFGPWAGISDLSAQHHCHGPMVHTP